MKSTKKRSLIKEQNKSLIMICVVIIIVIGVVGFIITNPMDNSSKNTDNLVGDDGIVNDLDALKGNK